MDYSVSPEAKFPVALQQLLDVYLFVSSDEDEQIKKALGYRPEEFILAGDSAGGALTMSVLLVLNDINRQIVASDSAAKRIRMPKSIFNLYAPYDLTLNISPSMILASCDSMISAGVMLSCFEAYLPVVNLNEAEPVNADLAVGQSGLNGLLSSLFSTNNQSSSIYGQMMQMIGGLIDGIKCK